MPTKTTTMDAWFGVTKRTTTMDALFTKTRSAFTTMDAQFIKAATTTMDAYFTDTRGTFRGTMTTADRDALPAKQPGDVVIVTDPT